MNKMETARIMAVLETAYPNFYAKKSAEERTNALALWTDMFQDVPLSAVAIAIKALIATLKFPPTIAEVKDALERLNEKEPLSGADAWRLVKKAINGPHVHYGPTGWDYTEAFSLLPEEVRRALGEPTRLREYANMDEKEFMIWEAPRFMRVYEARQTQLREFHKLPASVRKILQASSSERTQSARLSLDASSSGILPAENG